MAEVLEYLVRLRGAPEAAAQARQVAASQEQIAGAVDLVGRNAGIASSEFGRSMTRMSEMARTGMGAVDRSFTRAGDAASGFVAAAARAIARVRELAARPIHLLIQPRIGATGAVTAAAAAGGAGGQAQSALAGSQLLREGGLVRSFTGVATTALFGGILALASVRGIQGASKATQDLVVTASALSKVTGMNVNTAAQWLAVAEASGVSTRTLAMSFRALATQGEGATTGSKKSVAAFKTLGISAQELKRHSGDVSSLLGLVADRFNKLPGGVQKTQLAQQLFGRGWQQLIPLLSQGSKGLDELRKTAASYGVTLGKDPLANARKLHEAEIKLHLAQIGMQVFIAEKLAPAFIWLTNAGLNAWQMLREALGPAIHWVSGLIDKASDLFSSSGSNVSKFGKTVGGAFTTVSHAAKSLWDSLSKAFSQIVKAADQTFNRSFFRDLVMIGKQMVVFGGIVFDVVSRIVRIILPGLVNMVKGGFQVIGGVVKVVAGLLTLDFGRAWSGVKQIFGGALRQVLGLLQAVTAPFRAAAGAIISAITGVFSGLGSTLVGLMKGALNLVIDVFNRGIDTINSAISAIPNPGDLFGASLPTLPHIPHLARGGMLSRAGAVMVGDRGPEILNLPRGASVTPLDKASGWGGGDINLIVDGQVLARVTRRQIQAAMAANA